MVSNFSSLNDERLQNREPLCNLLLIQLAIAVINPERSGIINLALSGLIYRFSNTYKSSFQNDDELGVFKLSYINFVTFLFHECSVFML